MSDSSPLPPVRLRSETELARDALTTPLLARAVRLARWAGPDLRVGPEAGLTDDQLARAAAELDLGADLEGADGSDGASAAGAAWKAAVDAGLVEVADAGAGARATGGAADGAERAVTAGETLTRVTKGSPRAILDLWLTVLESVIDEAANPPAGTGRAAAPAAAGARAEADFLDGVLGNLYLISVGEDGPDDAPVPLPALAASMIVPEGMTEPTDDVLEQVSDAMVRLDEQFRLLETVGLVDFQPVDEALMAEVDAPSAGGDGGAASDSGGADDADVTRYGMVRLTALGRFGLHARLREAGFDAPVVGDLAAGTAQALLRGTAEFPQAAAQDEIEQWLGNHEPLDGARELLAAARGADDGAPLRRLRCQQALSLVGPEAAPALRAVLDDAELGGLARVWLTEQGAPDVPPPTEKMIFWLTIDTLAAQLAAEGDSEELQALVEGLAQQHSGFFDTAWRVDHPATVRVLETMGRLHPDKRTAKEARKAAFKARSQQGL